MPIKVTDLLALIEADGWLRVRQKGSHRQYHHVGKPGTVTVSGTPSVEVPPGTLNSVLKQAGFEEVRSFMQYLVVIEAGPTSYGAYVPDLPGCVAVGATRSEVSTLIHEAIDFHIEGMRQDRLSVPTPSSSGELVDVEA